MKIRLTQRQELRFLWMLVILAMIAIVSFLVWAITGKLWVWGVGCVLSGVVVIGIIVELLAVRIIHPARPCARVLTDEEQLKSIRCDEFIKKGKES